MQTDNPVLLARKTLGLTQSAMAKQLGVNISTIVRWEKGYLSVNERTKKLVELLAKEQAE